MPTRFQLNLLSEEEIAGLAREVKVFTGIYFLLRRKKVVYVGQSNNIYNRLARHIHAKSKDFDEFALLEFPLDQLNEAETAYIKHFRPQYNMTHLGYLRTPESNHEHVLNRGRSDRISPQRQMETYNKQWEGREDEWCKMVAAKLDAKPARA